MTSVSSVEATACQVIKCGHMPVLFMKNILLLNRCQSNPISQILSSTVSYGHSVLPLVYQVCLSDSTPTDLSLQIGVTVCTCVSDHGAALTAAWCQTFCSHEEPACLSVAACRFLAVIGISLHGYGGVNTFACCTLSRLCEVRSAADEFRIISDEVCQLPPMFPPWGNMDSCLPAEF